MGSKKTDQLNLLLENSCIASRGLLRIVNSELGYTMYVSPEEKNGPQLASEGGWG